MDGGDICYDLIINVQPNHMSTETAWMAAALVGGRASLGSLFLSRRSPCHHRQILGTSLQLLDLLPVESTDLFSPTDLSYLFIYIGYAEVLGKTLKLTLQASAADSLAPRAGRRRGGSHHPAVSVRCSAGPWWCDGHGPRNGRVLGNATGIFWAMLITGFVGELLSGVCGFCL